MKSITTILSEMIISEVMHIPSDESSIKDELSERVNMIKQLGTPKDSDGHNIAILGGHQLHYTGNIDNFSDMTLFRKHPHGGFEQTLILKGKNGVRGGITRNLNKMLSDGHTIFSSGMHSISASNYYDKLMKNSPHVEFSKYDFLTKQSTPINEYKDAFDGESFNSIRMKLRG